VAHLYVGLPSPPRTAAKAGVNTKGALSLRNINQERRLNAPLDAIFPFEVPEEVPEVNVEQLSGPLEHDVVIVAIPDTHHKGRNTIPCDY
jgi:hypothetical protein